MIYLNGILEIILSISEFILNSLGIILDLEQL